MASCSRSTRRRTLYDHPGNVFVAGFIGSPSMNFFDVTLVEQDGKLFVDGGTFKLQVPDAKKAAYLPHKGKKVIFGIRPEDIHDAQYAAARHHAGAAEGRGGRDRVDGQRNLPLPVDRARSSSSPVSTRARRSAAAK